MILEFDKYRKMMKIIYMCSFLIASVDAFLPPRSCNIFSASSTELKYTSSSFQDTSDPYIILNLEPGSLDIKEIKQAYRKMALKYHPDTLTGIDTTDEDRKEANDRFAKVNAAYAFLIGKSQDTPPSSKNHQENVKTQHQDWRQTQYYQREQQYNQYEKVKVQQSRRDDYMNWHGPNMNMNTENQNWASTRRSSSSSNTHRSKPKEQPVSTKHFCKGDRVKILGGEHRGSIGKVMTVYPNMVRVEINSALSIFVEGKDVRFMTASEKSEWEKTQPPIEKEDDQEPTESNVHSDPTVSTATSSTTAAATVETETKGIKANKSKRAKTRVPPPPPPPPPPRPVSEHTEKIKNKGSSPVEMSPADGSYSWTPSISMSRKRENIYQWNHDNIHTSQSPKDFEERLYQNNMFHSQANTETETCEENVPKTVVTEYPSNIINTEEKNHHVETKPSVHDHEIASYDEEYHDARSSVTKTNFFKKLFKTLAFGILAANIAAAMGLVWG